MNDADWIPVLVTPNQAQAEILRGLLEAQGISVWLLQEPAARAIGIQMGPLGEIQLLVPKDQQAQAKEVIDAFFRGDFEQT